MFKQDNNKQSTKAALLGAELLFRAGHVKTMVTDHVYYHDEVRRELEVSPAPDKPRVMLVRKVVWFNKGEEDFPEIVVFVRLKAFREAYDPTPLYSDGWQPYQAWAKIPNSGCYRVYNYVFQVLDERNRVMRPLDQPCWNAEPVGLAIQEGPEEPPRYSDWPRYFALNADNHKIDWNP